jgi:hypothetical protein
MKKFRTGAQTIRIILAFLILTSGVTTSSAQAATLGSKCPKVGQTTTNAGEKLTCSLIWVSSSSNSAASATPAPSKPSSSFIQSKSFRLESVTFNSELGSAGADARVTNTSKNTRSAIMVITIFKSDNKSIAFTMSGVANAVSPGDTVSVTFMSISGDLPSGQFKYTFQVSTEF